MSGAYKCFGKQFLFFIKLNRHLLYKLVIPFLGLYLREIKTYVCTKTIQDWSEQLCDDSPTLEIIKVSMAAMMDEGVTVPPHTGTLLSSKKETNS